MRKRGKLLQVLSCKFGLYYDCREVSLNQAFSRRPPTTTQNLSLIDGIMISSFDPACPWWLIALWLLLMLALAAWTYRRLHAHVQTSYRLLMLSLEIILALLGLILLAQPLRTVKRPEPGSFRIVVLADQSLSMNTQDGNQTESRRQILTRLLNREVTPLQRLSAQGRLDVHGFADDCQPVIYDGNTPLLEPLPGRTPLGPTLRQFLNQDVAAPLGAVLMMSDGRSNAGEPTMEVAKLYRASGIPVSCVGIGQAGAARDLKVQAAADAVLAQRDDDFTVSAVVSSAYTTPQTVTVSLQEHGVILSTQEITVPPGQSANVTFTHKTPVAGHHTYAFRIDPPADDSRPDNDLDFISVNVQEPPAFHILYLGGGLDWEWRFLNIYAQSNDQINIAAIIKTGPESFFLAGIPEEPGQPLKAFPSDTAFYDNYDAVILDSRATAMFNDEAVASLRAFVENKGGGILLRGPVDALPAPLRDILPVQDVQPLRATRETRPIVSRDFIFARDLAGTLRSAQGIFLPAGTLVRPAIGLKRAARPALTLPGLPEGQGVLLAGMGFGAGRCAYLGLESTWRWRLSATSGQLAHETFWNLILVWLSETSKPRVKMHGSGAKAGLGEEMRLDLDVLGDDFRPAPDARITALIQTPDGQTREIALAPADEVIGRYEAAYYPTVAGEHRVDYDIRLPASRLTRTTSFVARPIGVEAENTAFNEELLRDLARVTGGRYYTPEEFLAQGHSLPLSPLLPMREETRPLASSWLLVVLFCSSALIFWWLRRRIGLK